MKKSFYNSSDVLTLLSLKVGLKNWKRNATRDETRKNTGMGYKNMLNMNKIGQIE
jgi:hypothetical protein